MCVEQQLAEQVALRVAAADFGQPRIGDGQPVHRAGPVAPCVGKDATGRRHRHVAPHQPVECIRRPGFLRDGLHELVGLGVVGAGEAVEILQREEWLHRVAGTGAKMRSQLLPAVADVEACDFHPGEQRDGADLVLRVGGLDAPDVVVVCVEHRLVVAEADVEQRFMPPVVGVHEGVEISPGALRLGQKFDPLADAAGRQHDVGEGVLCPRLLLLELERAAGRGLGLLQLVHLLVAKGEHAVEMRIVGVRRFGALRDREHRGRVAAVEAEILVELYRREVAWELLDDGLAERLHRRDVVGDPALELVQQQRLARIGVGCPGSLQIDPGPLPGARRLEEHPGEASVDVGEGRGGVGVGRGQYVRRLGLVAQKARDEVVDPLERCAAGAAHFISEGILCHGRNSLCPTGQI